MPMKSKIVLTGAAGSLGHELRAPLAAMCDELVSADIVPLRSDLRPNESYADTDVSDLAAMLDLVEGADTIVHFAGIPDERPFDELLGPSFIGAMNAWEAAYQKGVRRVVYASSVHAVGMHETASGVDTEVSLRPDTFYGLSKCFAENTARLFWEKRGLESVCLRIFSCTPEPANARALTTWLSFGDLVRLVTAAVGCQTVGFTVAYGISKNDRAPVSNHRVGFLGYRPQDNAEDWAEKILAGAPPADPNDPAQMRIGGPFATVPLGESGVAMIKKMSEG